MNETLITEIKERFAKNNRVKIDKLVYMKSLNVTNEYPLLEVTDYNESYMTTINESGEYRRFLYAKIIDIDFTPDEHV